MRGRNELKLNEATIVEAVQEYLDKRAVGFAPKVENVKITTGAGDMWFVATVNGDAERDDGKLPGIPPAPTR